MGLETGPWQQVDLSDIFDSFFGGGMGGGGRQQRRQGPVRGKSEPVTCRACSRKGNGWRVSGGENGVPVVEGARVQCYEYTF